MFSKTLFWDIQGWSFVTYKHTSGDELWAKLDKNWHGASLVAYHIQNKKNRRLGHKKNFYPPPLFFKIWQFIRGGELLFFFTKLGMVPRWWPLTHHIYIHIYTLMYNISNVYIIVLTWYCYIWQWAGTCCCWCRCLSRWRVFRLLDSWLQHTNQSPLAFPYSPPLPLSACVG